MKKGFTEVIPQHRDVILHTLESPRWNKHQQGLNWPGWRHFSYSCKLRCLEFFCTFCHIISHHAEITRTFLKFSEEKNNKQLWITSKTYTGHMQSNKKYIHLLSPYLKFLVTSNVFINTKRKTAAKRDTITNSKKISDVQMRSRVLETLRFHGGRGYSG